jgi:hypothetical protein
LIGFIELGENENATTGFLIDPWKSIMIGELRENDGVLGFHCSNV